jgi:cytochrome c-type biogenesis protein CcmF
LSILILFTGYWVFKRSDLLKSDNKIDSFTSREGGFLYNNLILLLMCFIVLWGTLFPILSEAWNGEKIYVGATYFNQLNVPIGLALLFLMGIGPLLSWKKTSRSTLLLNFKIPMLVSFISGIIYAIFFGLSDLYPLVTCMGIFFTTTSIIGEFRKSYNKSKNRNKSILQTIINIFLSNRHKNGGYIVHIGITLLFVGFIGRAFEVEKEFNLSPGEEIYFANYIFKLNSITSEARDNHYAFISDMDVIDERNSLLTSLYPEKRIYFYWNPDPEKRQPHSELDIYSTMKKDIYSIFSAYDAEKNQGYFKIMINPLVNWVWIGGIVMVIGSLFAFWPSKRRDYGTI